MEQTYRERERPLSNGVTDACLNLSVNLPSEKDRLAKYAIISEKTDWQRKMREVGIVSIMDDWER